MIGLFVNKNTLIFIFTSKCGAICLMKGFETSSVSFSLSSLHSLVIKRAMVSSLITDKDDTRSFFDVPFLRLLSLESNR